MDDNPNSKTETPDKSQEVTVFIPGVGWNIGEPNPAALSALVWALVEHEEGNDKTTLNNSGSNSG